jgi:undecaprenyl-diphosphatase
MTILQALILGAVQGATEFIPVSSSAHLVLVPWLLGWRLDSQAAFVFDVLLHWGTLAALVAVYWSDLWGMARAVVAGLAQRRPLGAPQARLAWLIVAATVPAVALGLAFKDFFEAMFANPVATAALLLGTAALLALSEYFGRFTRKIESLNWLDALVIGLAQSIAILPGISRSGATIAGGLARRLERPAAARFSFLLSVPALVGAGLVALKDLFETPGWAAQAPILILGFVTAAVVGYLCIRWLLAYLSRRSLYVFAVYCVLASLLCLLVFFLRGY